MTGCVGKPGSPVRRLGVFGNPTKPDMPGALQEILGICQGAGVQVLASSDLDGALPAGVASVPNDQLVARAEVVVALGGDGTMLRAARILGTSGVPLLGVNLGSLGYLTDIPLDELASAVDRLLAGDFLLESRARVQGIAWRQGQEFARIRAFNDLVVNMGPLPRALDMEILLDGDSLGRFLGDGLIVSTPTGSTAYNLSAGGPICHAAVPCLLLAPICPHSLGMRPLIVAKDTKIELVLHETGEGAVLTADGQKTTLLANGDRLVFLGSDDEVNLIKFPESNFYRVMRHKLQWGAPARRCLEGS